MTSGVEFGGVVQLACNPHLTVVQPRDDFGLNNEDGGGGVTEVGNFIKEIELTYVEGG